MTSITAPQTAGPVGYRLEWKPGDYVHESVEAFAQEICKESARIWGLFTTPQAGCDPAVAVYKGRYWVQPKYVHGQSLDGFTPLYLGPVLHDPALSEEVQRLFPALADAPPTYH